MKFSHFDSMKKVILTFLIFAFTLIFPLYLSAQENDKKAVKKQSMAARKKELASKKEKQKAEEAAAMAELKKMHYENQDKKTQKRMKKAVETIINLCMVCEEKS